MPRNDNVGTETLRQMAEQLVRMPVPEEDLPGIAASAFSMAADMRAFRALPLADEEPATTYRADEIDA